MLASETPVPAAGEDRGQCIPLVLKVARPGMDEVLLREGRALAILGGNGTPHLVGVTRRDDAVALALGFVPGLSLDEAPLPALQRQKERWAQRILLHVGSALERAHGCGFSHHDVKPANILVDVQDESPECRLIDWGLASDETFVRSGTPAFLPPAVLRGEDVSGPQSDAYALAKTLAGVFAPAFWTDPKTDDWGPVPSVWERLLRPLLERSLPTTDAGQLLRRAREVELLPARQRDPWLLRSQYLAARAEAWTGGVLAPGASRTSSWLHEWSRAQAELEAVRSGGESDESVAAAPPLESLTGHERSRFLARLLGPAAANWELPATSDDQLIRGLERVSTSTGLWGATRYDLVAAISDGECAAQSKQPAASGPGGSSISYALRLGAGAAEVATLRGVLALVDRPEELSLEAARQARLAHDFLLAERLLEGLTSREAQWERVLLAKRQGEVHAALPLLKELQDGRDRVASQARALEARIQLDSGRLETALEEAREATRTGGAAAAFEVRALAELMLGKRSDCLVSLEHGTAAARTYEESARLASLRGMLHHQEGQPQAALDCFQRAAAFAERAGAPLEEATFLTGVAASASDLSMVSHALDASERAERLFDALRMVDRLPRVLLTQASVLAGLGLRGEVERIALRGRVLSRRTGDQKCEAYFELCLADVLPPGVTQRQAAERAAELLQGGSTEDRLHAAARVLLATSDVHPEADEWAESTEHFEARLAWYRARAVALCRGSASNLPLSLGQAVVDKIRALSQSGRRHTSLGPTLAAGAQLALTLGQAEVAREFFGLAERLAHDTAGRLRPEHVHHFRRLAWVEQSQGTRIRTESAPDQLSDVEGLLRTLSRRSGFANLLQQSLDMLLLWTGVQRGLILMRAPGDRLVVRAARNIERQNLKGAQRELSQSVARRALSEGRPVVMVDAAADGSSLHKSFVALQLRSVLAIPLVARGRTQGVAYLDDQVRRGAFGQRELAWAQLIGTILALSICDERDRLLLERTRRRAERAELQVRRELDSRQRELDVAQRQLSDLQADGELRGSYPHIIGRSSPMRRLLSLVDRVAQSEVPAMIFGESGTGKELIARAIAREGARRDRPFIAENCGAVPEALFESTLFGHERGAFTGAHRRQDGLFRLAHGGTLFLDEIAELPLPMQTKLLRVLQDGQVRPLGASRSETVDVRLLVATHRDLEAMVKEGSFREDLYYRLNVVSLRVPPLRERREDIGPLVAHFMEHYERSGGEAPQRSLSDVALNRLVQFDWPGNVRQLENEVRRMLVLGGQRLTALDLSPDIMGDEVPEAPQPTTLREKVDALEARLVREALGATGGNRTKAAEMLGISRYGLQKMTTRLGIEVSARGTKLDGSGASG